MSSKCKQSVAAVVSTVAMITLFDTVALAQQTKPQPQVPDNPPTEAPSPRPSAAIANWQQALVTRLARFQRYPTQAGAATGVVVSVSVSIGKAALWIVASSRALGRPFSMLRLKRWLSAHHHFRRRQQTSLTPVSHLSLQYALRVATNSERPRP